MPRTGLGTRRLEDADIPSVSRVFAYPIVRIVRNGSAYVGSIDGDSDAVVDTSVWSYKFDSVSVAQRAMARVTNTPAYPPCILYEMDCVSDSLSLDTTFTMLDGLVTSTEAEFFMDHKTTAVSYRSTMRWIDRLHDVVFLRVWPRTAQVLHRVHHYSSTTLAKTRHLCANPTDRLLTCDSWAPWPCELTTTNDTVLVMSAADHILARLRQLQLQFPHLAFDLTVFTTTSLWSSDNSWFPLRSVTLRVTGNDLSTIIRGRMCSHDSVDDDGNRAMRCITMLVDDFRYERSVIDNDVQEWFAIVALSRAVAQVYLWARLMCVVGGCYAALRHSSRFQDTTGRLRRGWLVLRTAILIPSQAISFNNWLAPLLYSYAHFIDSVVTHQTCEIAWMSFNGMLTFNWWHYLRLAAIQMRNVWYLVLAWKVLVVIQVYCGLPERSLRWLPHHGVWVPRGALLALISFVTIFNSYRVLAFRDSRVLDVQVLPVVTPRMAAIRRPVYNSLLNGFVLDVRGLVASVTVIVLMDVPLTLVLNGISWLITTGTKQKMRSFKLGVCRMHPASLSTGRLWGVSTLCTYWSMPREHQPLRSRNSRNSRWMKARKTLQVTLSSLAEASIGRVHPLHDDERTVGNKADKHAMTQADPTYQPQLRTEMHSAFVQLTNIACMSDPWVLLQLHVLGRTLFVYRTTKLEAFMHEDRTSRELLLPLMITEWLGCVPIDDYKLVKQLNSATLSWTELLGCV